MANDVPGLAPPCEAPAGAPPAFAARVYEIGINVAVDIPEDVSTALGGRGYVPVLGDLCGATIRATLVPLGGGRHRLFLNGEMRRATGLVPGDDARLRVWRDPSPREIVVPDDVVAALEQAGLFDTFLSAPPSHRREHVVTVEAAKAPATRARRIERLVESVRERRVR